MEPLCAACNLSWTKPAMTQLSLYRLNPQSNDCLNYLYVPSRQDFEQDSYNADRVVSSVQGRNIAIVPLLLDMESVNEKSEVP